MNQPRPLEIASALLKACVVAVAVVALTWAVVAAHRHANAPAPPRAPTETAVPAAAGPEAAAAPTFLFSSKSAVVLPAQPAKAGGEPPAVFLPSSKVIVPSELLLPPAGAAQRNGAR